MTGLVGPLVIPGETACYECFLFRQCSNSPEEDFEPIIEAFAFEGQRFVGFHPSMASILGDIAAFEITRFYLSALPNQKVGRLLEVNLLAAGMTARNVLKVPRCAACSPLHQQSSINMMKILFGEDRR
jgi:molybdopterin-synthase adenylyltransferase